MPYKQHPELTPDYPAIDGIEKTEEEAGRPQRAIRSDIEELLKLDDSEFDKWYKLRKDTVKRKLKQYQTIGSIPDLRVGSNWDQDYLRHHNVFRNIIEEFEKALDYIEKVRQAREEYQN